MNALQLTRNLLRFDTRNPPGQESACARFIGGRLEAAGFAVRYFAYADNRTSLVARLSSGSEYLPICFTGHIDTVPLGTSSWSSDPFSGETDGDRLYGRGASDMKSGLAALILAAETIGHVSNGRANLTLIFTAGEETCCAGAYALVQHTDGIGRAGAIVVAEPTSNFPLVGHKGAVRFAISVSGVAAHASTPELGVNAIYKAARAALRLETFDFGIEPDSVLGSPTLNVGTITGGQNINSVPDQAVICVDIRTIPGQSREELEYKLQQLLGSDFTISVINEAPSVLSNPNGEWMQQLFSIVSGITGEKPQVKGAAFFSDASVLTPAYGYPPTVILGPGEGSMAHKTDEYCYVSKVERAVEIYTTIAKVWCAV